MTENLEMLPFAGGWAEQPYWILQAISILKVEKNLYEKQQLDAKTKK